MENLQEPLGVAEHHEVARGPLAAEVDPLGLGGRPDRVEGLRKDGAERDRIEPHLHLAQNHRRHLEHVLDEPRLDPRISIDHLESALQIALGHTLAAKQAGPPQHGIERGAKLVRQDGQEIVLRPIGGLRLSAGVFGQPLLGSYLTGERLEVAIRLRHRRAKHIADPLDRHQGPRPAPKLLGGDGHPHAILGALPKEPSAPGILVRIGDDEDRNPGELLAGPDHPDGRVAGPARPRIEDDEVNLTQGHRVERRNPISRDHDVEVLRQHVLDEPAAGFAPDDEQSRPIHGRGDGRGSHRSGFPLRIGTVAQVPDSLFALYRWHDGLRARRE